MVGDSDANLTGLTVEILRDAVQVFEHEDVVSWLVAASVAGMVGGRQTGAFPAATGALPAMAGATSAVSGAIPAMTGAFPAMTGAFASITGSLPTVHDMTVSRKGTLFFRSPPSSVWYGACARTRPTNNPISSIRKRTEKSWNPREFFPDSL